MLTIREEIKKGEVKSDGTYNIKIRFTLDRKLRRLSTSLFATSKDLTKSLKLKEGTPVSYTHLDVYKRQGQKCLKSLHIYLRLCV